MQDDRRSRLFIYLIGIKPAIRHKFTLGVAGGKTPEIRRIDLILAVAEAVVGFQAVEQPRQTPIVPAAALLLHHGQSVVLPTEAGRQAVAVTDALAEIPRTLPLVHHGDKVPGDARPIRQGGISGLMRLHGRDGLVHLLLFAGINDLAIPKELLVLVLQVFKTQRHSFLLSRPWQSPSPSAG